MKSVCGGRVGSIDDPMLSAQERLRLKLQKEGKTLDDIIQDKPCKDEPKDQDKKYPL